MDSGLDTTRHAVAATTGQRAIRRHGHGVLIALIVLKSAVVAYLFLIGSSHAKWALAVLFAMLAVDAFVSFRRWRLAREKRPADFDAPESDARLADIRRRVGIATATRIGLALAFGGLLAASLALDLRYLGVGAIASFLVLSMYGGPVWLAAIGDEEDSAEELARRTPAPTRRSI